MSGGSNKAAQMVAGDVARAVRAFFDAELEEKARLATGAALERIRLDLRARDGVENVEPVERAVSIRSLEVERLDGDDAHVFVHGEAVFTFAAGADEPPAGSSRREVRRAIGGPLLAHGA